ncbi:MAG: phage holin family protein [Opitutaceae bacterium]|nr:phage holin family protein [Cytophagales bacterium]
MSYIISLLITALAVVVTAYLLPGVTIKSYGSAIIVALLIGLVNTIIKPIMVILTLPITILTLGLFLFVINALMILLVSALVPSFKVNGFLWALIFSIVLSFVNSILHWIL